MTLTDFLLARIHDDECLARMAFADHNGNGPEWDEAWSGAVDTRGEDLLLTNDSGVSRHIVNFDPARVLAECEAKRQIVAIHHWIVNPNDNCSECGGYDLVAGLGAQGYRRRYPCETLRLLALPYSDHPDYLPGWVP